MNLDEKLKKYSESDIYPFHMPGHKRQPVDELNPYRIDITEIDGFDNLHHAGDILKEAQERAAALYGAKRSFYLINGSTCGLLAAICAAAGRRSKILVARNCHKAVYHAISLWELAADYLYPETTRFGIAGQITPEAVKEALAAQTAEEGCAYAAVVITSPTYDGVVSDIAAIAEIVHSYGIPLIVDEAHGAHFGLSPHFPESAVKLGADVAIMSLHKTLPSYTQTALLHVCSDRIPEQAIEKYLDIFETSSPSYLLMAGMEKCIRLLTEEKEALFSSYWEKLSAFYEKTKALTGLRVARAEDFSGKEAYDFDPSKILIFTEGSGITGKELYDTLLADYGLQMEMVSANYVLAMTSIMDTQEGFDRLAEALLEIDGKPDGNVEQEATAAALKSGMEEAQSHNQSTYSKNAVIYTRQEQVCTIAQAEEMMHELVPLDEAAGRTAGDFVYLYPPGIPLLAPGERITAQNIELLHTCEEMGLEVIGMDSERKLATTKVI